MTMTIPTPTSDTPPPWVESNFITTGRLPKGRRMVDQVDLVRKAVLEQAGFQDVESFIADDYNHDSMEFWVYITHFNRLNLDTRLPGNVTRDATGKGIKLELIDDVFLFVVPEYIDGKVEQFRYEVSGPREHKDFIAKVAMNLTAEVISFD